MNKSELLSTLEESREQFLKSIEGLSEKELVEPGVNGEWSVKDILVHLTRWETELVKLLWQAAQGIKPTTVHFTQVSVDDTNERWYHASRSRPLDLAFQDFHGVRAQTLRRVKDLPEKALVDANFYPWLGGQPMWEWIAGDSFEHESEHIPDVIAWRESRAK